MKDTIYLVVGRQGVRKMTKRLPDLGRGEIPVKLVLDIDQKAFREPVIEQQITIADWRQGMDFPDIDMHEMFITEAEADLIRRRRLDTMTAMLQDRGYTITAPEAGT